MDYVIVYFKSCFIKLCINSIIRRYGMRDIVVKSIQAIRIQYTEVKEKF